MNTEDMLLAAIAQDRREDTPRLAYADFLDERGGPGDELRARFIRMQVETGVAARRGLDLAERVELRTRDERFWRGHDTDLVPPAPHGWVRSFSNMYSPMPSFRARPKRMSASPHADLLVQRGFVAEVAMEGDDWARYADALDACYRGGAYPLERVQLMSWPRVGWQADRAGDGRLVVWSEANRDFSAEMTRADVMCAAENFDGVLLWGLLAGTAEAPGGGPRSTADLPAGDDDDVQLFLASALWPHLEILSPPPF